MYKKAGNQKFPAQFVDKPIYNQKIGLLYLITANFKVQLLGYAIRVY